MAAADYYTQVYTMFVGYFGRPPAQSGLDYYANLVNAAGGKLNAVLDDFHKAAESQALFAGKTIEQQVNIIFQNLFGRDAAPAGLNYWAGEIAAGRLALSQAAYAIAQGAQTADKGVLTAKIDSAKLWVAGLDTTSEILSYGNEAGRTAGRDFLKTVTTSTPAAQTAVDAALKAMVDGGNTNPGTTYTLTSAVDNVPGTVGNDTIVAGTQAGADTLTAGDQINGNGGTDTLNIYAGAANFAAASIQAVEIVNVHQDASLDVSGNSGVQQAWSIGGAGKTITATLAQTVGFANASTGGAAVATFQNVAGSTDAATIAVKDAGKTTAYASVTVAGVETLTVSAAGTNDLGTLTATSAGKLVITGSGSVTTTLSDDAAYKTIDGSASTGALKITAIGATNSAQVLDIKTGTGADTYTTLFANLTKTDKIDLGNGVDTLAFADATDLSVPANVALLGGVTNVEVLAVGGAGAFKVDADLVTQAAFVHNSTGAFTGTNFASTDSLTIGAVNIADSTVAMKLGQNTLNLSLAGSKAAAADASKITVTGAVTVNVSSSGTAGVANNVLDLVTDSNGTINLTGSQNTTLTTALNSGTTGLSILGSAFTGKLTVTGTGQGDLIVGGSAADTITGGDGTDTLTGGAGGDTFVFNAADNAGADGAAIADVITDFVVGTDKLKFTTGFAADVVSGQQAAVQAAVTALAAGSTDAQIATAMANANTTDQGISFAVFNGNTYVYAEKTGATGTHVEADNVFIKLTGVTTAPTFAVDVVA